MTSNPDSCQNNHLRSAILDFIQNFDSRIRFMSCQRFRQRRNEAFLGKLKGMKYVTHRFWCFAVFLTEKAFLLSATLVKKYKIKNMLRNMNIPQFSIVITL